MISDLFSVRQNARGIPQNEYVDKNEMRAVLARNIKQALERRGMSGNQLAQAARISQSHLAKVLREEAAFSTDILASLASGLGVHPWELLADSDAVREKAIRQLLLGPRVPDDKAAEHLPPAPVKEVAARRRKKGPAGENPPH
jgi:transcriptional regulator with XRE-family HTH domain